MMMNVSGSWLYCSLINDPDLATAFNDLQFGAGALELDEPKSGEIGGTPGGSDPPMAGPPRNG